MGATLAPRETARRWARAAVTVVALGTACAEHEPGLEPPIDQLHFPSAVRIANALSGPRLIVLSSNFDQRFNAGVVHSIPLAALFERVAGLDGPPALFDALPDGTLGRRVPPLGTQLEFVDDPSAGRIYVTFAGQNRLGYLSLLPDGTPDCSNGPAAYEPYVDCTAARLLPTGGIDPIGLALLPDRGPAGAAVVGHVAAASSGGTVALFDLAIFERRLAAERAGEPLVDERFALGIDLDAASPIAALTRDSFLVLARAEGTVSAPLRRVTLDGATGVVRRLEGPDLGPALRITEGRRIVRAPDGRRAFIATRLEQLRDSQTTAPAVYNSAILVVDLEAEEPQILAALELGTEVASLGVLTRGGRTLLYVLDLREDRIFVVDATTNRLALVHEIRGRGARTLGGAEVRTELLRGPADITFAERDGRTLGIVANFGNGTLAIIDATAVDPRQHRLIARLGRVLNPDGTTEEEE